MNNPVTFFLRSIQNMACGALAMIYIANKPPSYGLLLQWLVFGILLEFFFARFSKKMQVKNKKQ